MHYVCWDSDNWSKEDFFKTGENDVLIFTSDFFKKYDFIPSDKRVLDIGCGVGRLTRAFSGIFKEAYGVDISGEMVEQAKQLNTDINNLYFSKNNGSDLTLFQDNFFDFCFSYIVFQHISDDRIIENYIREISRVLKPGGLFKFQVLGSKPLLKNRVPIPRSIFNFILRTGLIKYYVAVFGSNFGDEIQRHAWGVCLSDKIVEKWARKANLKVSGITGEDTPYLWCFGVKN